MAHNLEQRDGQASMFFTGDVPWHQLGRHLNKPATAAEAMDQAKEESLLKALSEPSDVARSIALIAGMDYITGQILSLDSRIL